MPACSAPRRSQRSPVGHDGAVGPIELIWTGKAVGSAWAGFSWLKVVNTIDGTVAYLLGTGITNYPPLGWDMWRVLGMLLIVAIAAISMPVLWRRRGDSGVRAVAIVFGGTFVAGVVFNLYYSRKIRRCRSTSWAG